MNIIGLGQAGCNIAEHFKRYAQYNVFKIDTGLKKEKGVYALEHQNTPEDYEE
jgi:cell division GTPase FtsZ